MEKKLAQRIHTKRRAQERFGLTLTTRNIKEIVKQIQAGKGVHIETKTNRISIWQVTVGEKLIRVVYDKNRKNIATVLPQNGIVGSIKDK